MVAIMPFMWRRSAQIEHLGAELKRHGQVDLVLLLLAVAAMSTARYW